MTIAQRDLKGLLNWLAIALTVSLLVSCSSKLEDAIIGKWSEIGGAEIIEFFEDGTVTIVGRIQPRIGNYKFVEKDRIEFNVGKKINSAKKRKLMTEVSISGDDELTLTWTDLDRSRKYRRVMK